MLILTRREKESIIIGDNITVTVLDIRSNQVRLGVTAPSDVEVFREELHQRIKKEQLEKNNAASDTVSSIGA